MSDEHRSISQGRPIAIKRQLCQTCAQVVQSKQRLADDEYITPGDQSFESFRKAAAQSCFICSTLWSLSEQHRSAWESLGSDSWKPLSFRIDKGELEFRPAVIRLHVAYHDPIIGQDGLNTNISFRMIPLDTGEHDVLLSFIDVGESTSSPATLNKAYSWYQNCLVSHDGCKRLQKSTPWWLPTRLIDIGAQGDTVWRLQITSKDIAPGPYPPPSYMTLSYRWGSNSQPLLLLSRTMSEFRRGKPISNLPQTFKDLVHVARRFDIRYLWIDSICIIQDSESDWKIEAPTMRHVYANSACNVAASASVTPHGGLFRLRKAEEITAGIIETTLASTAPEEYFVFDKSYWDRHISQGGLHKRGWVFQECFLAPRVLYFATHQILWECMEHHKCEGFPNGIPLHRSSKNIDRLLEALQDHDTLAYGETSYRSLDLWNDLVRSYSSCQLTKPNDKLVAFEGIARLFQEFTSDVYVAGIWKSRILDLLDWRIHEPTARLSSEYRAPSWSWASIDGPVIPENPAYGDTLLVELIDDCVVANNRNTAGSVVDACLKLRGTVIIASYEKVLTGHLNINVGEHLHLQNIWPYRDTTDISFLKNGEICFLLYKSQQIHWDNGTSGETLGLVCLILQTISRSSGTYRRIGYFVVHNTEIAEYFTSASHPERKPVLLF